MVDYFEPSKMIYRVFSLPCKFSRLDEMENNLYYTFFLFFYRKYTFFVQVIDHQSLVLIQTMLINGKRSGVKQMR